MTRTRNAGYTLVELLMVVAIVSILAVILFGVFTRVREKGRQTTCSSNLRQIGLSMLQYVQDNDGAYPSVHDFHGENLKEGSFGAWYVKSPQIFWCPSGKAPYPGTYSVAECGNGSNSNVYPVEQIATGSVPIPSGGCSIFFSNYFYNTALLNTYSSLSGRFSGKKEWEVKKAAETIVGGDHIDGQRRRAVSVSGCPSIVNTVPVNGAHLSTVHSDGANYLYADGHVKRLSPEGAAKVQCAAALNYLSN